MGTHPIFESDFDCLTEGHEIVIVIGNATELPLIHPVAKRSLPV